MTPDEIRAVVKESLHRIAPEADLGSLAGGDDLLEAIDLDSMDILNFFVILHDKLNIDIAERDYGRLRTVDGCFAYIEEKLR